jgi:hypothetical protein
MKQIIIQSIQQTTIALGDVPENPIIGFVDMSKRKGWCQPTNYCGDNYKQFAINKGISIGNGYNTDTLERLLKMPQFTYFLFDNEKELFKWLAE